MRTKKKFFLILIITMASVIALLLMAFFSGIISMGSGSSNQLSIAPAPQVVLEALDSIQGKLTFPEAVECFALKLPHRNSFSRDQQAFLNVLDAVQSGNYSEAQRLSSTLTASEDSLVHRWSRQSLGYMLEVQRKWEEYVAWVEADPTLLRDAIVDQDDLAFARAFREFPEELYRIPEAATTLPMSTTISGHVMIEVTVNGEKKKFLLDTGADVSVVSTDIVEELGIDVSDEKAEGATSTSITVEVRPGLVHELRIGNVVVKNHPVGVVNGEDLEFSLLGFKVIDIDGILGLPFFLNLTVTMDFVDMQVTLARSTPGESDERNLFWFGYPVARLSDKNGTPLLFGFDTGSIKGGISRRLIDRLGINSAQSVDSKARGAGGSVRFEALEVDSVQLFLDNFMLTYRNARTKARLDYVTVIKLDGILGRSVAKHGSMRIDFANGRLDLNYPLTSER